MELIEHKGNEPQPFRFRPDIVRSLGSSLDEQDTVSAENPAVLNAIRDLIDLPPETQVAIPKNLHLTILRITLSHLPNFLRRVTRMLRPDQATLQALMQTSSPVQEPILIEALDILLPKEERMDPRELLEEERREIARMVVLAEKISLALEEVLNRRVGEARKNGNTTDVATLEESLSHERVRRETEHELLSRKIIGIKPIGMGVNLACVIRLRGRALPCIYKAQQFEKNGLRLYIERGSYYRREWLAAQIDRTLQLNVVPATVVRDGPDGIGSVQDWKIGTTNFIVPMVRNDLEAIAILDAVTQNTDRHDKNFLVTPDGRGVAIDHGLIFSAGKEDYAHNDILKYMEEIPPTPSRMSQLKDFLSNAPLKELLNQCFFIALGEEEGEDRWQEFIQQVTLIANGMSMSGGLL